MDSDTICRLLDEARKLDQIKKVIFTGGEPFIYKDLNKIVNKAGRLFPRVSIATNCSWATSYEVAKKILRPLVMSGLSGLLVSADAFHQEFIPVQNVKNAINVALAFGVAVGVRSIDTPTLTEADFPHGVGFTMYPAVSAGRARGMAHDDVKLELGERCPAVLAPTVLPDGNVQMCISSLYRKPDETLVRGNIYDEPFDDILRRTQDDPILRAVVIGGFQRLIDAVQVAGLGHKLKPEYADTCALCVHLLGDPDMLGALQQFY